jgi:hypothetical protein
VELVRQSLSEPWGFELDHPNDRPSVGADADADASAAAAAGHTHRILEVAAESIAARDGALQPSDTIVTVNQGDATALTHDQLISELSQALVVVLSVNRDRNHIRNSDSGLESAGQLSPTLDQGLRARARYGSHGEIMTVSRATCPHSNNCTASKPPPQKALAPLQLPVRHT